MALASGAPIVPGFVLHESDHYRLIIDDPIWPAQKDSKEEEIRRMTEMWCQAVERCIRRYPDQWAWVHNRWKTKQKPKRASKEFEHFEKVIR